MNVSEFSYRSIDEILTGRLRLAIMAFLMGAKKSDFLELLQATDASKGNLGAHIRILEEASYIIVTRTGTGRSSHMAVEITPTGQKAFQTHIKHLQSLAKGNKNDR